MWGSVGRAERLSCAPGCSSPPPARPRLSPAEPSHAHLLPGDPQRLGRGPVGGSHSLPLYKPAPHFSSFPSARTPRFEFRLCAGSAVYP